MENRNVLVAVILSTLVIMIWQFEYADQYSEQENIQTQTEQFDQNKPIAPSLDKNIKVEKKISREDAIKDVERVSFENDKIKGSISLIGALIDDVILKNYNVDQTTESKKVVLLNPKQINDSYFLETGWATSGNETVPDNQTKWEVKGNQTLKPDQPITLEWNNQKGLTFSKKIEIDGEYLITVKEEVKNNSNQKVDLFHYAQISRKEKPDI